MATVQTILYENDEPVVIDFIEGTHRYKVIEPLQYSGYKPGVTSVLKVLNKPALMQYAANKAVETFHEAFYTTPNDDGWTEAEFKDLCSKAKYAHLTYRDARAEIGKKVHAWIEAHIAGVDEEIEEEMTPSIEAFLDWESKVKPTYIFSEKILYSKQHDYCGAMDCGAIIDGVRTIIDFKTGEPDKEYNASKKQYTGKFRGYNEHFIQQGAYSIPLDEEMDWKAEQLQTIYLPATGGVQVFTSPDVDFFAETFLCVLDVDRRLKRANKLNEYRSK
jgi:hypothetical protein